MNSLERLLACLDVLQKADPKQAYSDEKYRMDMLKLYNVAFGLACKILTEAIRNMGMSHDLDHPEDFFRICAEAGFISDQQIWEDMRNDRNLSMFVYNEKTKADILVRVISSYIPVLAEFASMLQSHIQQ